jgi:hypothetical protein
MLKLFTGETWKHGEGTQALGIENGQSDFDFARRKGGPQRNGVTDWEPLIEEAREAFLRDLPNEKSLETARDRYREELALAAEEMRLWGAEYEKLHTGSLEEDRYRAIQDTGDVDIAKLFGVPVLYLPTDRFGQRLQMSLSRDLFDRIERGYFKRHPELPAGDLAPEGLMEELVYHRGVINPEGDSPVTGLTSEEIERYLSYKNLIGNDIYVRWGYQISQLQKIYENSKNIFERKKKELSSMRSTLFHLFPPLKTEAINPRTRKKEAAWKWLNNDARSFQIVMEAFADEAASQIAKIQKLHTEKAILDYFLPILPLVDQTLRFFPENKATACAEYRSRRFWDGVSRGVVSVAEIGGAAATGLGPVGTVVGSGIVGVALLIDYQRLQTQRDELARTKAHELASWTQNTRGTSTQSSQLIDQLERAYAWDEKWFLGQAGLSLAFTGYSSLKNLGAYARLPRALNRAQEAYISSARSVLGLRPLVPRSARHVSWSNHLLQLKQRFWLALRGHGVARYKLFRPLERRGLVPGGRHLTLAQRWNTPWIQSAFRAGPSFFHKPFAHVANKAASASATLLGGAFSTLAFVSGGGHGVLGKGLLVGFLAGGGSWLAGYFNEQLNLAVQELAWDSLQQQPELYEPLLRRVMSGQLSPQSLRAILLANATFQKKWVGELHASYQLVQAGKPPGELQKELRALRDQVQAEKDAAGPGDVLSHARHIQIHTLDKLIRELGNRGERRE